MSEPGRPQTPVDHGCSPPLVLVVDVAGVVLCTDCRRRWTLGPAGWEEVEPWPC